METRNMTPKLCLPSGQTQNCSNSSAHLFPKTDITAMLLWSTIGVTIIITNSVYLIYVGFKERCKKISTIIVNSTCITSILYSILYILPRRANPLWFHIPILCRLLSPLGQAFAAIICIHLCLISLDRYFAILNPFLYKKYVTRKRVIALICIFWIISSAICIVPAILIFSNISRAQMYDKCQDYDGPQEEKVYIYILYLALFSLPLVVSFSTYSHITLIIQFHTRGVFTRTRTGVITKQKQSWRRRKAYKQFGILLCTFLLFFLPYITTYLFIKQLGHHNIGIAIQNILSVTRYIAFFYPAVIPLLYTYFTADSKKKLQELSKRATRLSKRSSDASDDRIRRCSIRERYI